MLSLPRCLVAAAAVALAATSLPTSAFVPVGTTAANSRWTFTTTDGSTGSPGDPITLTWSIVPDGTDTLDLVGSGTTAPSDLIADLDSEYGAGPGGADLTQRPWFPLIERSFERWNAVSGVTYVYEPNDDGADHGNVGNGGQLGVRGDVRVSGVSIDGGGGTLAYNYFPNIGDMALDTDDLPGLFGNSFGDFRNLRNTIMHEAGHGLGLEHVNNSNVDILLDPTISTSFDGPQHDDLRGIHWFYGDALEKAPAGRNETAALASPLGLLNLGATLSVGTGGAGASVEGFETDFVSITNENDADFFSFTLAQGASLTATMTPRGATYTQNGVEFVTTETADLTLAIFDTDGVTPLGEASLGAAGVVEEIADLLIEAGGTYYARVESASAAADQVTQFYQLDLTAVASGAPLLLGDFNGDGVVNAPDYTLMRDTFGDFVTPFSGADHDGSGRVDLGDYGLWFTNFGATAGGAASIPEPGSGTLLFGVLLFARQRRSR